MKRYECLALTAIALTITGCQPSSETSDAEVSGANVAQANNFTQGLPGTPDPKAAQLVPPKPRFSTHFSASASQKPRIAENAAALAKPSRSLAASLKQNLGAGAGRDNPFRSVNQPQVEVTYAEASASTPILPEVPQVSAVAIPAAPSAVVAPASAVAPTALTAAPVTTVVAAAPLPTPVAPPALPMVVPPTLIPQAVAPVSPTAIAESIEIKGVVQVGEQFNIIIRDPNAPTSRTVKVGDVIGGGKVRVSRVDAVDSQEPQIVLEQDGVEIIRSVGV